MIVRRRTLLLASVTTLHAYVVPHSRITPIKYRAATEEEAAPKPDEIVLGAPFDVAEYPINTDEFVNAYKKWQASNSALIKCRGAPHDLHAIDAMPLDGTRLTG